MNHLSQLSSLSLFTASDSSHVGLCAFPLFHIVMNKISLDLETFVRQKEQCEEVTLGSEKLSFAFFLH